MYTTHRTVGSVIPHVYAKKHTGGEQGMAEGRVHTHGTLSAVRRHSERSARSQSSCQVRQAGPKL